MNDAREHNKTNDTVEHEGWIWNQNASGTVLSHSLLRGGYTACVAQIVQADRRRAMDSPEPNAILWVYKPGRHGGGRYEQVGTMTLQDALSEGNKAIGQLTRLFNRSKPTGSYQRSTAEKTARAVPRSHPYHPRRNSDRGLGR